MPEDLCGGWGWIVCHCGGDLCFCGMDGESCPGCDLCEDAEIEAEAYEAEAYEGEEDEER